MIKHGMTSATAKRVRLTGNQLKNVFSQNYCFNNEIKKSLKLIKVNNKDTRDYKIKAGANWQFHLGSFNELTILVAKIEDNGKKVVFKNNEIAANTLGGQDFFQKYAFNKTLFVCRKIDKWQIYKSKDILNYISENSRIRVLPTGRVKIDLKSNPDADRFFSIFTIEYRAEKHKKQFVFGAHGGSAGERLRRILEENLFYTEVDLII